MRLPTPATNYNVGDTVAGRDCVGSPFRGVVDQRCGPYTLLVDGVYTPTTLIDEVVSRAVAPADAGGVFD